MVLPMTQKITHVFFPNKMKRAKKDKTSRLCESVKSDELQRKGKCGIIQNLHKIQAYIKSITQSINPVVVPHV